MELNKTVTTKTDEFQISIVFRIKETLFSVSSEDVFSIQQLPSKLLSVPHAFNYLRGSYKSLGEIFSVIDLRSFFEWVTIEQEYNEFTQMIDQRKQDHMNWVNTLKHCKKTGERFTLAKDCHQCALGKWRDQYHTNAPTIQRLLHDLDIPHQELHALAEDALRDTEESDRILEKVELDLMPKVLQVLESMKTDFRDREFREMLLLLRGESHIALIVDEVLGVEKLSQYSMDASSLVGQKRNYVRCVRERVNDQAMVMELDTPRLTSHLRHFIPEQ